MKCQIGGLLTHWKSAANPHQYWCSDTSDTLKAGIKEKEIIRD